MMSTRQQSTSLPTVGPWAREKLDRLGRYLSAYTTIMKEQSHWCKGYVYVDAFAGAGRATLRRDDDDAGVVLDLIPDVKQDHDQRAVIDGSPAVALGIDHPFTAYVFVEMDADRLAALRRLKDEYGDSRRVLIREGDCNGYLRDKLIQNPKVDWKKWRAVVFLDPFGMHVPWSTIAGLAATRAVEVIINFPVGMSIQRLLLRSGQFTDKQRARLDEYFGSPDWFDVVYDRSPGLFGQDEVHKAERSGEALLAWYLARLQLAFGYVSAPYLVRNSKGGHLYYLLFAGPKASGAKIASHVLGGGKAVRLRSR